MIDVTLLLPVTLVDLNAMAKVCDQNWHGKCDKVVILTLMDTGR
jgi:hypothetical protein